MTAVKDKLITRQIYIVALIWHPFTSRILYNVYGDILIVIYSSLQIICAEI